MAKFVLLYTGGGMPESEEEQAAVLAAWGAWYTGLGEAVADPGAPFLPAAKNILSNATVGDGPIGGPHSGYTVLVADSMDSAVGMTKGCPMLAGNGQITIYEAMEM
jgi:hypothetical protein